MLEIAETFAHKSNTMGFNEDAFFAFFCERLFTLKMKSKDKDKKIRTGCLLAKRKAAYSFAVEIPIIPADINMTLLPYNYESLFAPMAQHSSVVSPPISFDKRNKSSIDNHSQVIESFIPIALHCTWAYINPVLALHLLQLSIKIKPLPFHTG